MSATVGRARGISQRVQSRARLIRAVLLLSAATSIALLAGCNAASNLSLPGAGPLLTVRMQGGLCMNGPCDSAVVLERDGRVHDGKSPPTSLGRASADAYAALDAAIRSTNFAAMRLKPFTGECPIAFDGQKQVFEFSVGSGAERLDSCESELDWSSPVFIALIASMGNWVQAPLL